MNFNMTVGNYTGRCPELQAPVNGQVNITTSEQLDAHYSCDVGFRLVGYPKQTCIADGTWTGAQPTCVRVLCDRLFRPFWGEVYFSNGFNYSSVATYSCGVGQTLVGQETRVCQENGTWSGDAPLCATG